MEFNKRLQILIDEKKVSSTALANATGVHRSRVSDWLSGKTKRPHHSTLLRIADFFSCNPNWLATGEGTPYLKEKSNRIQIRYLPGTYAAAGDGAVNYDDAPEAMTFDRDFLISQIGVERFKGLHIIHAVGDSMAPGISPGDLLFVNPAEREIRPGAVYVVQIENKTLVKRLDEDPIKKEVVLKSDNKDYQPLVVTGDDLDRLRVIGRVIGNFRKI